MTTALAPRDQSLAAADDLAAFVDGLWLERFILAGLWLAGLWLAGLWSR